MNTIKTKITILLLLVISSFFSTIASGATNEYDSLQNIFSQLKEYGQSKITHESVYLHLDNSSYYRDDKIWFKAYIFTDNQSHPTAISGTLYVELLNPAGKIVDRKTLKITDGQCHGQLTIEHLPFYSGFYEVRAYTRYMLETDQQSIYSRVIPVFENQSATKNDSQPTMLKYGMGNYDYKRPKPLKDKSYNLKVYPEGGHLVNGITSRVACEVTDKEGRPVNTKVKIINKSTNEIKSIFETKHNGRGIFNFLPDSQEYFTELEIDGKTYRFNLPEADTAGVVMTIDNISYPDNVNVNISRNNIYPNDFLGLAVISRGSLYGSYIVDFSYGNEFDFMIEKRKLPIGAINLILFDTNGTTIAERMIFNNRPEDLIKIELISSPKIISPFQPVDLTFSIKNPDGNPLCIPFSLSVADTSNYVTPNSNILSEILLSSELKGYIDNPNYYFSENSSERQQDLDCLMMIQGWKKYSWEEITGSSKRDEPAIPESGIEVRGKIVSFVRSKPIPNATISAMLFNEQTIESENSNILYDILLTDSLGRFSFKSDFDGNRTLVLSVSENGKGKDHRILLDRSIVPEPRRYEIAELTIDFSNKMGVMSIDEYPPENTTDDIDNIISNDKSIIELNEVTVKAKKNSREHDIYKARSKSVEHYDMAEELDIANDKNIVLGQSLNDLLMTINPNFSKQFSATGETLLYKGREPLYVIDYEPNYGNEFDSLRPKYLYLESIKSIYLNEDPATMLKYAPSNYTMFNVDNRYGCAVFIETDPNKPSPPGKGTRRTILKGYSPVEEFYSPDYSYEPIESDYRRTIYWNPNVLPDEKGVAHVKFYNNATSRNYVISAETVSGNGTIGFYNP